MVGPELVLDAASRFRVTSFQLLTRGQQKDSRVRREHFGRRRFAAEADADTELFRLELILK